MRFEHYFLPVLKEQPLEAQVVSHRLMLRSGMISQHCAGIYTWLPLGAKVLKKIEAIIRQEQNKAGSHEVIMPTIQSADLWRESKRFDAYGQEMLRIKDRHDRDLLYTPTAEEVITDLARRYIRSYRDIPKTFYQIQWKFRDEIRPRFGVMRGREFLMKDGYSLDRDEKSARLTYQRMMETYLRTFKRMGLVAVPVRAPTGPIGGDLSHEFHILASTGESLIYYDKALNPIIQGHAEATFERVTSLYAMEDELHNSASCPVQEDDLCQARGIEVGHVFYYGTKYSELLQSHITGENGEKTPLYGGCYGIGVSRLVAAIIEANHDEAGIKWPLSVAPFHVSLLNLKPGHDACDTLSRSLYETLNNHMDVLWDERDERSGVKFATHDLIGSPFQVRIGPKGAACGMVDIKNRMTGEVLDLSHEGAITYLSRNMSHVHP